MTKYRAGSSRQVDRRLADYVRLRDGGICVYCQDAIGQQIDHVIPLAAGGPTIKSNLVLCCSVCNQEKKGKLKEVYLAKAFKHLMRIGENIDWVDDF